MAGLLYGQRHARWKTQAQKAKRWGGRQWLHTHMAIANGRGLKWKHQPTTQGAHLRSDARAVWQGTTSVSLCDAAACD